MYRGPKLERLWKALAWQADKCAWRLECQGAGLCSCPHGSLLVGGGLRVGAEGAAEECAWVERPELLGCLGGLGWLSSQHPPSPRSGPTWD